MFIRNGEVLGSVLVKGIDPGTKPEPESTTAPVEDAPVTEPAESQSTPEPVVAPAEPPKPEPAKAPAKKAAPAKATGFKSALDTKG